MRAKGNFTPMNAGESEVFGFDFVDDLPAGDSIQGLPSFSISVLSGVDPNVSSMLTGNPSLSGTQTLQRVSNPKAGVIYQLQAFVNTLLTNGLVLWAPIVCQVKKT